MVERARRVVRVGAADGRGVAVVARTVLARLVHVAQRRAVTVDVDLLAEQEVRLVGGQVRVPLHARAEDVGCRLVEATGVARVVETGRVLRDAVAHLVAGDVELRQRVRITVTVAVRHLSAVPERVDVVVVVVDAAARTVAVVPDAVAAHDALVVVERRVRTVLRVDAGALTVRVRPVAPDVVGVRHRRAVDLLVVRVGRVVARVRIAQLVRTARAGGGERDVLVVDAVARGVGDLVERGDDGAGVGVDERADARRRAVLLHAGRLHHVGELLLAGLVDTNDEGAARALGGIEPLALLVGLGGREALGLTGGLGDGGCGVDGDGAVEHAVVAGDLAGGVTVDDEVATDDGDALEGAVDAHVRRAVGVLEHVLDLEGVVGAETDGLDERRRLRLRGADEARMRRCRLERRLPRRRGVGGGALSDGGDEREGAGRSEGDGEGGALHENRCLL